MVRVLSSLFSFLPYRLRRLVKMSIDLSLGFGGGGFDCVNEVKAIKSLLRHKTEIMALDIGANRGDWARAFLETYPNAKLICFEPDPLSKDYFKFLFKKFPSLELHNVAVADRNGSSTLYSKGSLWGGASLVPLYVDAFHLKKDVELITLDSFTSSREIRPDIIKIDVEGAEMLVLKGAINTLPHVSIVQFEFSDLQMASKLYFRDFFDLFSSVGFKLGRVTPAGMAQINVYDPLEESYRTTNFIAYNPRKVRL